MSSETVGLDNSPRIRRIIQAVVDLRRGDLRGARILDLGSAHGAYALELARRGATCLGVEGRSAWVQHANASRDQQGLHGAQFVQGDVRDLDSKVHGRFDISLCLGLLYHLTAEAVLSLLQTLYEITDDFIVIDTQFALEPQEKRLLNGSEYYGIVFPEHPPGTSSEQIEANLGAALDGESSFWFTLPSLMNMLGEVGFSTAYQLMWPTDHMYKDGEFRVHEDYVTLVALKGARVGDVFATHPSARLERAPEDPSAFTLERAWSQTRRDAGGAALRPAPDEPSRGSLRSRLKAAAKALWG